MGLDVYDFDVALPREALETQVRDPQGRIEPPGQGPLGQGLALADQVEELEVSVGPGGH